MAAALGAEVPIYAHLPMILGSDGAKLSKRHGAVDIRDYREQGFLPEAVLNYLVRLGWSHGDQEVFSREEMIRLFDIQDVNVSASRFNPEKLAWLNQQYIMKRAASELIPHLESQLKRLGLDPNKGPSLETVIEAYRERSLTLGEMANSSRFAFEDF